MMVAVLFARADSNYKAMQGVDVWDAERDARRWPGGEPVFSTTPPDDDNVAGWVPVYRRMVPNA